MSSSDSGPGAGLLPNCKNMETQKKAYIETTSKKPKPKIWYKYKEKKKKSIPPLLRLSNDIIWIIFRYIFTGVYMVDIVTTQRGTVQRRYGAQSLLFVCKELREVAMTAMFQFATFEIPHFKLHEKHRRENKMTTLHRIQNLALLWTPTPSRSFTTKRGDDAYVLANIDHLRSLEVWLLAGQHVRLENIDQPDRMSRVELHDAMLARFEPSIRSQPRWLKRLLRDAPKTFKDIDVSLVGFFAFGPVKGVDLTVSVSAYFVVEHDPLT